MTPNDILMISATRVDGAAAGAPSYSAEAEALFARMVVQPDNAYKADVDAFIVAMIAGGFWNYLKVFYWFADPDGDSQRALLDWRNAFDATTWGTPTFTNQGVAGVALAAHGIDTGWAPDPMDTPYEQDSAHIGLVNLASSASGVADMGWTSANPGAGRIVARQSLSSAGKINVQAGSGTAWTGHLPGCRHAVVSRETSIAYDLISDGVLAGGGAGTSDGLPVTNLAILSESIGGNSSGRRIVCAHAGGSATSAGFITPQFAQFYTDLKTFAATCGITIT